MHHFEDLHNRNHEQSLGLGHDHATSAGTALDVAGIDSCLVFWPDKLVDLSRVEPGHVRSEQADAESARLLVGKVLCGHPYEAAVVVLGTLSANAFVQASNKLESNGLSTVGFVRANGDVGGTRHPVLPDSSSIWITVSRMSSADHLPNVVSVHFTGSDNAEGQAGVDARRQTIASCAVNVIVYTVPNSRMLQYFALESLRLAPVSGMKLVSAASALLLPDTDLPAYTRMMAAASAPSVLQNKFLQLLSLDPVHWRSFRSVRTQDGQLPRGTSLRNAIDLINRLQTIRSRLSASIGPSKSNEIGKGAVVDQRRFAIRNDRPGFIPSAGNAVTSTALAVQRLLRRPLFTAKEPAVMIEGVDRRPRKSTAPPVRLVTISASARQLDVRISQLVVAPRLASRLRYLRKKQKLPINEIAAPYIGLWNAVWLIANDIILGHAVSVLLLQNKSLLATIGRALADRYLLDYVLWLLSWLENWPAGLKLNTELSLFFSDAYSSLTSTWHSQGLLHILPRLDTVIVVIALTGRFMGVTMVLCMMQDLISICTLHITVFYTLSFRTLRAFIYVLSSLFNIFRGKKRNALRGGRLDDASYELDQLLLGTLLFTLVAFLSPTVYVYYLAFGLIRFVVVAFESGIVETCLGLLNHLPLFALMLRIKDPHRLPAGVWLQELDPASTVKSGREAGADGLQTGCFRLRSRPLAIGDIFEGYGQHVGGLFEVPSMLLRCLLGRSLRPS
ncbi:N-acetylglucosaminyl transferase component [Kalmanozyma brasiliensis GHG001]|nr:N-acetylglucosaminyl transferase component [Kalmanozyma brasiliensis GHG001]EST09838.2 N-acetylglucosaminyl transferase component [Kalmanozyma brasiliensis GHG001]